MTMGMRGALWVWMAAAMLAPAAARADDPQLSLQGGSGRRGETVAVVVRLAGDPDRTALTADLDIAFSPDLLELIPPVKTTCAIAPRLAETHQVGGTVPAAGLVRLSILARGVANNPLGDGDLASCQFHILPDALSSPAALDGRSPLLGDSNGEPLPVVVVDGAVRITDAPNACVADCDGDGEVRVNEVITGVNIALDNQPLSQCPAADANGDGQVTIGEVIAAVGDVINGC